MVMVMDDGNNGLWILLLLLLLRYTWQFNIVCMDVWVGWWVHVFYVFTHGCLWIGGYGCRARALWANSPYLIMYGCSQ